MAATAAAHDWPASPVTTVNRPLPVRSSVAETRLPFRSTSHTWGIVVPVGCQKSAWPMSCGDVQGQAYGIMIIRVPAPALSHLRPALRLAGPARPVIGLQGRRAARAAARGRRAAPRPPRPRLDWADRVSRDLTRVAGDNLKLEGLPR